MGSASHSGPGRSAGYVHRPGGDGDEPVGSLSEVQGKNQSWRYKSGTHWHVDSISSHRTGVITALDQGKYMRRGKVAEDKVPGRVRCSREDEISCVRAAKGPRRKRLATRSVLLIM